MSSSRLEFGSINHEIIRRNLVTDFLLATSLPVNVPIHRSREAIIPNTPMREEFDRCTKKLKFSLACKLFSFNYEEDELFEEDIICKKNANNDKKKIRYDEFIFRLEL